MVKTVYPIAIICAAVINIIGCSGHSAPTPDKGSRVQSQQSKSEDLFKELDDEVSGRSISIDEAEKKSIEQLKDKGEIKKIDPSVKAAQKESLNPSTKYPMKDGYPVWFSNPDTGGYIGAVGIAKPQATGGVSAQRRTAKILAQKELASRVKVLVDTEVNIEKINVDTQTLKYYQSKMSTMSRHQAEEYLSDFETEDEWIDPQTKELYLWVVLKK